MSKYEYLKQFINDRPTGFPNNWFGKVTLNEIETVEKKIGFEFPLSLKEFWLEIGYGFLRTDVNKIGVPTSGNLIMHPFQISDILLGVKENSVILPDVLDAFLEKGDIPFFHVADSSDFINMKLQDKNSAIIYRLGSKKLEESFEKFIWRLYHESSDYYHNIGALPAPKPE